jgi:hypothetical protein
VGLADLSGVLDHEDGFGMSRATITKTINGENRVALLAGVVGPAVCIINVLAEPVYLPLA